jgi:multidrug efflux pump subunit AcrB
LLAAQKTKAAYVSAYIGQQQFLLNRDLQQNFNEVLLSLKVNNLDDYQIIQNELQKAVNQKYPRALVRFGAAKNVFEQLFNTSQPPIQLRIASPHSQAVLPIIAAETAQRLMIKNGIHPPEIALQKQLQINILDEKLLLYGVQKERLFEVLKTIFNDNNLGILKAEQQYLPLIMGAAAARTETLLQNATVLNNQQQPVSVKALITSRYSTDYKTLYSGKEGNYVPFDFEIANQNVAQALSVIKNTLPKDDFMIRFSGSYFINNEVVKELGIVILVAIALLFFILTAQFESLTQPLIVMITIVFGITGALGLLYMAGNSLNVMSAIGMVVLLGILDNDSILKIDTMNRNREALGLMAAIKESGKRRLKSQLMTFLTTILGVVPVLFTGGLGSELQQPLALALIGGMTAGLLASLTLIPLLYYWTMKRQ